MIIRFRAVLLILLLSPVFAWSSGIEAERRKALEEKLEGSKGGDRVNTLYSLCEILAEARDSTALGYSEEALLLARSLRDDNLIVMALNQRAHVLTEFGDYEGAIGNLKQTENYLFRGIRDDVKAVTFWRYGEAEHQAANYNLAEYYYNKGKGVAKSVAQNELEADITSDLAANYRFRGEYDTATELYFEALRYYESVNDSQPIVKILTEIGIIDYYRGEIDKSLAAFTMNRDYHARQNDSLELGLATTLMGLAYFKKKEYEESIRYSKQSVNIREKIGDVKGLGESLNNLALAYMGLKDWEMAGVQLEQSLKYLKEGNDLRQIPVILSNIGDIHRKMGKFDNALDYYQQSLEQARVTGLRQSVAYSLKKICNLYRDSGDFKVAYDYQVRYAALKDSLFNEEKNKVISDLNLQYDTEKKEQEILMLKREQEVATRQKIFLGIGLGMVVIISLLVLSLQRLSIRKNKMLHEKEKQIMRAREALTDSELRNTRNELEYNKRMLANYMENILRKNSLLEELETQIHELNIPDESADVERETNVRKLLNMKILTNEDWQEFKRHFDQVHTGLMQRLKKQYPDMTRGENRLFILLKLRLGSKEISNILGVSPDTVKKSRHRLRKKLDLSTEVNILDFVDNFN
jgi:tetratricopeptide (TPR) repeat protein/DNA-binding CsgD family transcriptional regulator